MPRRLLAIAAICLGTALAVLDGHIVTVALPTIARDLKVDDSASVLIVTVYQLTLVMAMLPFSSLGDRIGLRRLYQYGQLLFTVATALCFFADNLPFLLAIRVLQGIGAAASLSVMVALIRNTYPSRLIGQGLGVNSVIVSVTLAASPSLGGLIIAVAPWPCLFAIAAPFAMLSLWLGWKALPDVPPAIGRYNVAGAGLSVVAFGLTFGGLECAVRGVQPALATVIIGAGALCMIWLIRHERGKAQPILPTDLLAKPVIGLSALGGFISFAGGMLLLLSTPFRLEQAFGFSPAEVGAILTPYPAMMMIIAPLGGMLSDRVSPGILGAVGMAITAVALVLLAFPPAGAGALDFAWRLALCGLGSSLYSVPNARLIVSSTPHHRTAAAGGLIQMTRLVGQTVGATLLAVLLAVGVGVTNVPLLVAAGFAVVAGICSLARTRQPAVAAAAA